MFATDARSKKQITPCFRKAWKTRQDVKTHPCIRGKKYWCPQIHGEKAGYSVFSQGIENTTRYIRASVAKIIGAHGHTDFTFK